MKRLQIKDIKQKDRELFGFYISHKASFNCYSFSMNHCNLSSVRNDNMFVSPGEASNKTLKIIRAKTEHVFYDPLSLHKALVRDGALPTDRIFLKKPILEKGLKILSYCYKPTKVRPQKKGFYLTACFSSIGHLYENAARDFHFYRKFTTVAGEDYWGHKRGDACPEIFDSSGNVIKNPVLADRKIIYRDDTTGKVREYNNHMFLGYYYVPNIGLSKLNTMSTTPSV